MTGFREFLLTHMLRPKILSRDPGRLRIKIPYLESIPRHHRPLIEVIARLLHAPDGIEEVDVGETGRVVIDYDADSIGPDHVLRYISELTDFFLRNRTLLGRIESENIPAVVDHLEKAVRADLAPDYSLRSALEIPQELVE